MCGYCAVIPFDNTYRCSHHELLLLLAAAVIANHPDVFDQIKDTQIHSPLNHPPSFRYAVYNDLGGGKDSVTARPDLGGSSLPFPRRLLTGRPRMKDDPSAESKAPGIGLSTYLPKNDTFTPIRLRGFIGGLLGNVIQGTLLRLTELGTGGIAFESFKEVGNWFTNAKANSLEDTPAAAEITKDRHGGLRWPTPAVYDVGTLMIDCQQWFSLLPAGLN
jgi:Lipoxygenase